MTNDKSELRKVGELIKDAKVALVTTVDAYGKLVSRPLAVLDRDFEGELWFFTPEPSPKTDQVKINPQVNVAVQTDKGFLSISGTASISHDRVKIDELWNTGAEAWFEGGKEDPSVALLRVDATTVEYWAIDAPKIVQVFKYAKAVATGTRPDVGESKTLHL
jgi:general stress protein 26